MGVLGKRGERERGLLCSDLISRVNGGHFPSLLLSPLCVSLSQRIAISHKSEEDLFFCLTLRSQRLNLFLSPLQEDAFPSKKGDARPPNTHPHMPRSSWRSSHPWREKGRGLTDILSPLSSLSSLLPLVALSPCVLQGVPDKRETGPLIEKSYCVSLSGNSYDDDDAFTQYTHTLTYGRRTDAPRLATVVAPPPPPATPPPLLSLPQKHERAAAFEPRGHPGKPRTRLSDCNIYVHWV